MKATSLRIVLSFYSAEEGEPQKALDAIRSECRDAFLVGSPDRLPSRLQSFAALRLDGETLIVAEVEPAKVQNLIQRFEGTGSPAIFVLRPDLASLPPVEARSASASSEPTQTHWARQCAERREYLGTSQIDIIRRLGENERTFEATRADLAEAAQLGHAVTAAAEWMLDNSYLIRMHSAEVRRNLPRDYPRLLPTLAPGYELAKQLVGHADHELTQAKIEECLRNYQEVAPFATAELWLFPLLLRVALIDTLSQLGLRVNRAQQLRETAYLWANRLAASARREGDEFQQMLGRMEEQPIALEPYFLTSLLEQLQDEEVALAAIQHWIEGRLKLPVTELVRSEHTQEAAESVLTASAFGSLRALARMNFPDIFEAVSVVETQLRRDSVYLLSDFATRDECRRVVERISRYSGMTELDVARKALALAEQGDSHSKHVEYYLLADGVLQLEAETNSRVPLQIRFMRTLRRWATEEYQGGVVGLTACLLTPALVFAWEGGVREPLLLLTLGCLAVLPLSELAIQILNALIISLLPPGSPAKMDFRKGIPVENATLVVVPMMLTNAAVICREVEKLEVRFLANRDANLCFALLSDFIDADTKSTPQDAELLKAAQQGIADLNGRYPGESFLLFHRERLWSHSEELWIGRERKRGKIEELNEFLCGASSEQILVEGKLPRPIRYVITLDVDTQLPPGTARRMIETISHPLNRAEIDPVTRVRKRGYAIIQPRVSIGLPDAQATRFTRLFADTTGTDPYCHSVSDANQDLFGEGIFHGKAIYDVQAFRRALEDRFPAETLLSHDLIEGAHAGVALASDIELFENLPLDYASYSKRQHRWIRGDWQIAPWILPHVPTPDGGMQRNPLSVMNRWRILDNLRRSMVPVASLLLLLFGWLISVAPAVWSLVVGLAIAIPALAPFLDRLARHLQGTVQGWRGAADELARAVVMIAFLPHQAWITADAVVRVHYRRTISHRRLLEWQTAAETAGDAPHRVPDTLKQMLVISGFSLGLLIVLYVKGTILSGSTFLALWIASPAILYWLSGTAAPNRKDQVDRSDRLFLRSVARRTWRFFDDLIAPERNWLPPDNSQVALRVEVAERTSPTNIGLWLASALSATDCGYLTVDDFVDRCTHTMDSLARLERYEGHPLNWYDTRTLQPLTPRYVSTVDSGNLVASLWVLERGCHDRLDVPILGPACLRGLHDTLGVLREECGDDPSLIPPLQALRRLFRGAAAGHLLIGQLRAAANPVQQLQEARRWQEKGDERSYWISCLARELTAWTETGDRYLKWTETLSLPPDSFIRSIAKDAVKLRRNAVSKVPSLAMLAKGNSPDMQAILAWRARTGLRPEAAAWLDRLASEYQQAQAEASQTVIRIRKLSDAAAQFADGINMRFLYDPQRRLFGIGYAVGGPLEFTSHYDLLASECRLASLIAIAKGDVPTEHWYALSRPLVEAGHERALLSWSGTMFEFLMPLLFTRTYPNSLLDQACRTAVRVQMEYGRQKGLPWGISESAYSALDSQKIYQYRAFGVPSLALKPTLDDDLVVAPYATVLALPVDAGDATDNLKRLRSHALDGPMGFYDSIDFSREAAMDGKPGVVVYTYMAHHQGMSLVALNNILHRDVMRNRFHGDVRIRAVESLLFERVSTAPLPKEGVPQVPRAPHPVISEEPEERIWKEDTSIPRVHLQGNGSYSLMVTNAGGGYSRWNQFDLTRWRADTTRDCWGSFLYIRDLQTQSIWASAYHPTGGRLGTSAVSFSADRAEFQRTVQGIESLMKVTVAAEDNVEIRRLTVTNRSSRTKELEFTSYAELALAPHRADASHAAFSKMFIETDLHSRGVLIAHRRPRSPEDPPIWAAHLLLGASGDIQHETDRAAFLGRARTGEMPEALRQDLAGHVGTVLDPIFSLRCRVKIEPRERLDLHFLTIAALSREALLALISRYQRPESSSRAFEMAWTRAQLEFRYLGVRSADAHRFQQLASHLLYPNARLRPPGDRLSRNNSGQSELWAYGISGDLPILAVATSEARHLPLMREILLAHSYWRMRGFAVDLLILNQEIPNYDRTLHQQLTRLIEAHASASDMDRPGGIFLRDWYVIPEEQRNMLLATVSAVLYGGRGSLQQQLMTSGEVLAPPLFAPSGTRQESPSQPLPFLELPYFNGLGGFTPEGREYAIYLKPGSTTPSPWVNVFANPTFGAMVSESGLGCTWNGNSQTNRLTPWHNDPVSDPPSEIIYLRDDETGAVWTPTPLPIRERDAYRARHGQGYTVFEHNSHGIGQELTVTVPLSDPVKLYRLRLRNDSGKKRRFTITYFAEWVLGSTREDQQARVQTSHDETSGALLATQHWSGSYKGQVAFAAASPRASFYSGDRTQFLGRNGSASKPAALDRVRLDNRTGAGLDPCAALQLVVSIDGGQQAEVTFLLGEAPSVEAVRELAARYQSPAQIDEAVKSTQQWWNSKLGALQVHTPLMSADLLLNRWLLYQTLSCRFWGRAALYQSSGAFGFRDQLQDCLAFLYSSPDLTRGHILAAAGRQFVEGDVQHWWHADSGLGVRTRISDDLLWLPFVVAHYVEVTADTAILDEKIPFLDGTPLTTSEKERVFVAPVSEQVASLREHCRRAIDHAWRRGVHGLPLFGTGDWNDGMNEVGAQGRGESVWLAMFLYSVLQSFGQYLDREQSRERAAHLSTALDQCCWDGAWYLRGFFDDGTPLGSHASEEAKIDSLTQSWAVISGAVDPARAHQAMKSAWRYLVDEPNRLVLLFTPPFDHSTPHPGYIMGYPPGVRENGGQYTHGSLWMASAFAAMGDGESAVRLLKLMNPVECARDPKAVEKYGGEPYVAAADVSSAPGKVGRSGWTWYSGSAGWMYRIWIEEVLGFRLRGEILSVVPSIPDDWPGFEITYRYRSATYEIAVRRGDQVGSNEIQLVDDGTIHKVTVWIPLPALQKSVEAPQAIDAFAPTNLVTTRSTSPSTR